MTLWGKTEMTSNQPVWGTVAGDLFRRRLFDDIREQFEPVFYNRLSDPWFGSPFHEGYRVRNMIWNQIQDEL